MFTQEEKNKSFSLLFDKKQKKPKKVFVRWQLVISKNKIFLRKKYLDVASTAATMAFPLMRRMNYSEIARNCFVIEPLPPKAQLFTKQ